MEVQRVSEDYNLSDDCDFEQSPKQFSRIATLFESIVSFLRSIFTFSSSNEKKVTAECGKDWWKNRNPRYSFLTDKKILEKRKNQFTGFG